jgi:hypothetical protein
MWHAVAPLLADRFTVVPAVLPERDVAQALG